ncbi:MAG TPA: HAD-IIA family hydrolase [Candidatus Dormibacteraeota bacterium]
MHPRVRLALIDLDGTLYTGSRAVDGAAVAVQRIRDLGLAVMFTTNTDSIAPQAVADRLTGFGIECTPGDVLTPLVLAASLLNEHPASRALVVASPGARAALANRVAGEGDIVTHVVVADPSYGATYAELDRAFQAVRTGARLVATQMGRWVRRDDGDHLDTGGWVRLLEYATERDALVLGKPSPEFFRLALSTAGATPAETVVVGDDRASDIAGGRSAGCHTVLVLTGKGTVSRGPEAEIVAGSIADVPDVLVNNWRPTGSR